MEGVVTNTSGYDGRKYSHHRQKTRRGKEGRKERSHDVRLRVSVPVSAQSAVSCSHVAVHRRVLWVLVCGAL